MQTDAKELRAAAKQIKVWSRGDPLKLADYILATVREDDGEEQPPTIIGRSDRIVIEVQPGKQGKRIRMTGDSIPDATITFNVIGPYTRRQFRALCEGLGINTEEAGR